MISSIFGLEQRHNLPHTIEGYHPSSPMFGGLWGGGAETSSGVVVTPSTALTLSAVWACVRVIAETTAGLPLGVFRRDKDSRKPLPQHAAANVFRGPNPNMNGLTYREVLLNHILMWGNSYSEIIRDESGRVTELWPLHPQNVDPEVIDGKLQYTVKNSNGKQIRGIQPSHIFHITGPLSNDGITGKSVIQCAAEQMGEAIAAQNYAGSFWEKGAVPSMAIKKPGKLSDRARTSMRQQWEKVHGGATGHRVAVLDEGMEIQTYSMPNNDAQFLESRQFHVVEVCRWFRVPPHKVQWLERATFTNIEEQERNFAQDSILPWCNRFEAEGNRKLFASPGLFYLKHNIDALMRGKTMERMQAHQTAISTGIETINEARKKEDMDPIGDEGDMHLVPLNMTTAEKLLEDSKKEPEPVPAPPMPPEMPDEPEPQGPDAEPIPNEAAARALRESLQRAISRQMSRDQLRAVKASARPAKFLTWAERYCEDTRPRFRDAIQATLDAMGNGEQAQEIAASYVLKLKQDLLRAAEVSKSKLPRSVADMMEARKLTQPTIIENQTRDTHDEAN